MYKAKKRQVIAIVLITNKLTYANEANALGDTKAGDHGGGILTWLWKHAEKYDGTWDYAAV